MPPGASCGRWLFCGAEISFVENLLWKLVSSDARALRLTRFLVTQTCHVHTSTILWLRFIPVIPTDPEVLSLLFDAWFTPLCTHVLTAMIDRFVRGEVTFTNLQGIVRDDWQGSPLFAFLCSWR